MQTEALRTAVRSLYDAQKIRIEMGNRIAAQKRDGVLSDDWEARLTIHHEKFHAVENGLLLEVGHMVKESDVWPFLKAIKGVGPAMAGVIIAEVQDPARFDTVSKLWAYSGLHVVDGAAARRKKGERANWNGFLKAKLLGVLAECLLRGKSEYRKFYDDYQNRCRSKGTCSIAPEAHAKPGSKATFYPSGKTGKPQEGDFCTLGHLHNKASRYMVKMLLADLWREWRTLRGLECRAPYAEEYLGKEHHG